MLIGQLVRLTRTISEIGVGSSVNIKYRPSTKNTNGVDDKLLYNLTCTALHVDVSGYKYTAMLICLS